MYTLAWMLVGIAGVYLTIGVAFAVFFVTRGVARIDPAAKSGSVGFRLLLLPGAAAFWPLLMRRYQEGSQPPEGRDAHRDAARASHGETTQPAGGSTP